MFDIYAKVKEATPTYCSGFGLLGHLSEMLRASKVSAHLDMAAVPLIPGVRDLAKFYVPGGSRANLRFMEDILVCGTDVSEEDKLILADAQTSGGMLISVASDKLESLLKGLATRGVGTAAVIGEIVEGETGRIVVGR